MFGRFAIAVTGLVLLLLLQTGLAADPPGANWTLQFSDEFNRSTLHAGAVDLKAPDWQIISGNWRIDDGMLCGDSSAIIMLMLRFPGDQRVEFDAVAQENVCDLSAMLNTSEQGDTNAGYFFGFGSEYNAFSRFLVKGREVKRYEARITPGKLHHVICQREGSRLTHILDGQVVATYDHDRPLAGAGHEAVGFYIFGSGKIDNVKVFSKRAGGLPERFAARTEDAHHKAGTISVEDPLFEELFSDTPGPTHFFSYGGKYDWREDTRTGAIDHRATAKRFGFRFVYEEQLEEAAKRNFIVYGRMSEPAYAKRGIATQSIWVNPPPGKDYFYIPDVTLQVVTEGHAWIMDPRYQAQLVRELEQRAREGDRWGVPMFDELWTHYVIKPVPRSKWYREVEEADQEIREKYGFGRFGMPESHEGGKPFEHIAYRRWAADKLTQTFEKAYKSAKSINPKMKIIGPTEGSNGSSADLDAWAPYFDILGGQCAQGGTSAYFDSVRVGAVTKSYVDLTDNKPIWMMVHLCVRQSPRRQPEDVREAYSQVFRNGGQGLWLMHAEFFEAEMEDAMFAEPARWRTMLQLTETIRNMRLPLLPEADCAILWSSDSMHTTLWGALAGDNDRIISNYTILGPLLRSWFHFVSDRQIDRGTRDLVKYKVLYVPFAPYQRASVVEKIAKFVEDGGMLVCTDSDAFTWNIDGQRHGQRWEDLCGVRRIAPRAAVTSFATAQQTALPISQLTLESLQAGWQIETLSKDVQVLASFPDGSPAVTLNPHGKGKVIYFAADPLWATDFFPTSKPFFSLYDALDKKSLVRPGAPIVKFVEAIQKATGAQMGRDIWRFKLPPLKLDPYQKGTDLCLTNNYIFDVNEPLLEPNNLQTGGTYAYSRPPDGIPDMSASPGEPIPFAEGKLTNRLRAYQTRQRFEMRNRNFEQITPNWIASWTSKAPVAITFDLKSEQSLTKCRFFYSGSMPALTASGSADGKNWEKLSSADEEIAGKDVKDVTISLPGKHRYVRLDFATRKSGESFQLCETELWGKPR